MNIAKLQVLQNLELLTKFFLCECRKFDSVNWAIVTAPPTSLFALKYNVCLHFSNFKDTQEFLRVLMDLLHEELKEPVRPVVTKQESSTKKPANKVATRSKRLLGGQTIGHNQNREMTQGN